MLKASPVIFLQNLILSWIGWWWWPIWTWTRCGSRMRLGLSRYLSNQYLALPLIKLNANYLFIRLIHIWCHKMWKSNCTLQFCKNRKQKKFQICRIASLSHIPKQAMSSLDEPLVRILTKIGFGFNFRILIKNPDPNQCDQIKIAKCL